MIPCDYTLWNVLLALFAGLGFGIWVGKDWRKTPKYEEIEVEGGEK